MTDIDLNTINSNIDSVENSISSISYGTASLRIQNQSTTINFTSSKYIILSINGYIRHKSSNQNNYLDLCMSTIVIQLGNTVGRSNITYQFSDNNAIYAMPINISNTSTTSITYNCNLVNTDYVTYTSSAYLNYLLIT